jgi:hypothetical protein
LRRGIHLDLARLHRLGDLAHQLDREQAVAQVGASVHADEVGQLEAPLERAGGDAHVQEIAVLVAVLRLAAGDHQQVLARGDVDLVCLKPATASVMR